MTTVPKTCKCLPLERRAYIESKMHFAEDFSDGAFMAFMEESGIDVSELEIFSTTHDCTEENL
jgi:hypothetical protein